MSNLTDDELDSIERSLGGPSLVATSKSETCRMVAELRRRRSQACEGCGGRGERLHNDGTMHGCDLCAYTGVKPQYYESVMTDGIAAYLSGMAELAMADHQPGEAAALRVAASDIRTGEWRKPLR